MAAQPRSGAISNLALSEDADDIHTLADLERRQDDVLAQLDELDKKLTSLLTGLGVTLIDEQDEAPALKIAAFDDEESVDLEPASAEESPEPATLAFERRKVA